MKNSNYSVCLLSSQNLLKLALSNINNQFVKIDHKIASVSSNGISFNSDIYANKLKNISESSNTSDESINLPAERKNSSKYLFKKMVLLPYIIIFTFCLVFNTIIYLSEESKQMYSNLIYLVVIGATIFLFIDLSFNYYLRVFIKHQSTLLKESKINKSLKNQSDNSNNFIKLIHDYLDTLELYASKMENIQQEDIRKNYLSIEKYRDQLVYINEILKNDTYKTDFNEVVHKVLKTCDKETEDLGIKIEATSEHPISIDISETSLFFILSVIINESMKKSTKDSLIIIEARKENNKVRISVVDENAKIPKTLKDNVDKNVESLDLKNIQPSENGFSFYVVKTILGRYGGQMILGSNFYGNNVQIILPLHN